MSRENIATFDPTSRVWVGPMGKYPYALNKFVGELVIEALDKSLNKVIQINHDEGSEWIAGDLKLASIRVAQNFAALGIKSDDVIGFNVTNTANVYPLILGCVLTGALVNPLHVAFRKENIKQMFQQTLPKIVICDSDVYITMLDALNELQSDAKVYTVIEKIEGVAFVDELLAPTGFEAVFIPSKFDKTADKKAISISLSSGTTGDPKGAVITHAHVLSWFAFMATPAMAAFKTLSFSPIMWGSTLRFMLKAIFNPNETRISTKSSFSIETMIRIVERYKPAAVTIPPNLLTMFLNSPLSKTCDFTSVRVVASFGSIVKEDLREQFKLAFPNTFLATPYALTESLCAVTFFDDSFDGLNAGKVAANVLVKIVDENEKHLGINEKGEVRIKFEFGFAGYYKNKEATEDALDSQGFFKTGDIAYVDEYSSIYIVDRIKEVFKSNNFHISPNELETFISSIEGVEFVCVVGIPDPKATNLVAAVVTKLPEYDHLTEEIIANSVAAKFPTFKHLQGGVYFVAEIPITPSGKFKKHDLKEIAVERFRLQSNLH